MRSKPSSIIATPLSTFCLFLIIFYFTQTEIHFHNGINVSVIFVNAENRIVCQVSVFTCKMYSPRPLFSVLLFCANFMIYGNIESFLKFLAPLGYVTFVELVWFSLLLPTEIMFGSCCWEKFWPFVFLTDKLFYFIRGTWNIYWHDLLNENSYVPRIRWSWTFLYGNTSVDNGLLDLFALHGWNAYELNAFVTLTLQLDRLQSIFLC